MKVLSIRMSLPALLLLTILGLNSTLLALSPTTSHEALATKLANNTVFKRYTGNALLLSSLLIVHRQSLTQEAAAQELNKVNALVSNPTYLLPSQKDELAQAVGYPDWAYFEQHMSQILDLRESLLTSFPELTSIGQTELMSIFQQAYERSGSAYALTPEDDRLKKLEICYTRADAKYAACLNLALRNHVAWQVTTAVITAACVSVGTWAAYKFYKTANMEPAPTLNTAGSAAVLLRQLSSPPTSPPASSIAGEFGDGDAIIDMPTVADQLRETTRVRADVLEKTYLVSHLLPAIPCLIIATALIPAGVGNFNTGRGQCQTTLGQDLTRCKELPSYNPLK
ncbi:MULTISPECIES: hypothetical protein [Spirosoma]|uniref:Uncharacterized protein n=1 Tax=Spirosoma sordidisoli TaxID=2502893 RepID=A0A4Q2UG59_9BACT|nr:MULTISPECIES: hypothetical protein [Spirosoma]RYC66230.1 hypothetical protein EQG79_30720 [Spirosoma sordidisoli]